MKKINHRIKKSSESNYKVVMPTEKGSQDANNGVAGSTGFYFSSKTENLFALN